MRQKYEKRNDWWLLIICDTVAHLKTSQHMPTNPLDAIHDVNMFDNKVFRRSKYSTFNWILFNEFHSDLQLCSEIWYRSVCVRVRVGMRGTISIHIL
ncbi:unnamed protein product [Oppiella nova]|uniref:Uncharacterized protein n=1 Tax=Oppiella nova TaxID=334625 RepID=A0A7R9LA43_9ACAR|nr:unnamed protein product [Oppiella nova]CAG2158644.1 unnamed protein product [Oppiella nova]